MPIVLLKVFRLITTVVQPMQDIRNEQLEALSVMVDYIPKLKKGMTGVAAELSGERLADTD